ncbi:uncharacterized protein LOC141648626 [Silene latifolia]|uniref:uncharacterized protein LOC141648626 n=1 Tax=Silene latifolia TaxID=37657 RepID=UPI003D77D355
MRKVKEKLDGYFGIEVDSVGRSGGLAMLWRKDVDCSFMSALVHHMDFSVKTTEGEWMITGFYGWPAVGADLSGRLTTSGMLVMIVVLGMYHGRDIISRLIMVKAGDANRQSMLDRALCTAAWTDLFPFARIFYLAREWFEQIWIEAEGCSEAVDRGVEKGGGHLVWVLQECARELRDWKGMNINCIGKNIGRKLKQVEKLNTGLRTADNVHRRKKLLAEIAELRRKEEQFWRQRSRALWLKDGDKNTKFFHTRASERKRKNHIAKLVDDDGRVREGDEQVAQVAKLYFQELFLSSNPTVPAGVLAGLGSRVMAEMNEQLRREYTEEEVIEALNQMHPLKAPGPDGMNGLFYQTYWSSVGPDVISTVLAILRGQKSSRELNKTNIVLIRKKKAPDKIRDFRPISLCNVAYKLVSKVLANRLKPFLGEIVSEIKVHLPPGERFRIML